MKPGDYRNILHWGVWTGSMNYYIRSCQERAVETAAPRDAIFERVEANGKKTGKWARLSDLPKDHEFRVAIERFGWV